MNRSTGSVNWLSPIDVENIIHSYDHGAVAGLRSAVILGLLAHIGMEKKELLLLEFTHIEHTHEGVFLNISPDSPNAHKSQDRAVPINEQLCGILAKWGQVSGGQGRIAKRVSRSGRILGNLSKEGVSSIVREVGMKVGIPTLCPSDFRRSWAKTHYNLGMSFEEIAKNLGYNDAKSVKKVLGFISKPGPGFGKSV